MPDVLSTDMIAPRVPLVDPATGLITREWYRFLFSLFNLTGGGKNNTSLLDVQLGPNDSRIELLTAQVDEILKDLDQIAAGPKLVRHQRVSGFGVFYDTTTQTVPAINTATAITFNNTHNAFGISRGSPTSRLVADRPGLYNVQVSAQFTKASAASALAWTWLRKNGVDVPNSSIRMSVSGSGEDTVTTWSFLGPLSTNEYFELMWMAGNADVQIPSYATTPPAPATPSIIVSVADVNQLVTLTS